MRLVGFETTPNPNAMKCVIEGTDPASPVRSYFNAAQAQEAGDGLACALFAIPGVTNVLVHTAFVTVGKAPDAKWAPIRRSVRAVLQRHGDHADE
tara:strand:+ start:395 stop:679 length:285 start_codon:yes stop_codon:yes gene_type:complete